jgi:hypothetical protein
VGKKAIRPVDPLDSCGNTCGDPMCADGWHTMLDEDDEPIVFLMRCRLPGERIAYFVGTEPGEACWGRTEVAEPGMPWLCAVCGKFVTLPPRHYGN